MQIAFIGIKRDYEANQRTVNVETGCSHGKLLQEYSHSESFEITASIKNQKAQTIKRSCKTRSNCSSVMLQLVLDKKVMLSNAFLTEMQQNQSVF